MKHKSTLTTPIVDRPVIRSNDPEHQWQADRVAVEEPLQIRMQWSERDQVHSEVLSITLRTPGNDRDLILGLLYSEGIIDSAEDVILLEQETDQSTSIPNQWTVELLSDRDFDPAQFSRHLMVNSACGLCGKTTLQALELKNPPDIPRSSGYFNPVKLAQCFDTMRDRQQGFEQSGGMHGAALFNSNGEFLLMAEDIGRHNALDKLVGQALRNGHLPSHKSILLLSGRASYELIHKAIMAGIPAIVAVGAPSSLAIEAARRFDLTLIGFYRDNSYNIYHGDWRLIAD